MKNMLYFLIALTTFIVSCKQGKMDESQINQSKFTINDLQGTWWSNYKAPAADFDIDGDSIWYDNFENYHHCWVQDDTLYIDLRPELGLQKSKVLFASKDSLILVNLVLENIPPKTYYPAKEELVSRLAPIDTFVVSESSITFYFMSEKEIEKSQTFPDEGIVEVTSDFFHYLNSFNNSFRDTLETRNIKINGTTSRYIKLVLGNRDTIIDRTSSNNFGVIFYKNGAIYEISQGIGTDTDHLILTNQFFGIELVEKEEYGTDNE